MAASENAALLNLLATDSDVRLRFDDGQTVPGHSQVLKLWSGVLRTAIEAEGSGRPFSSANPLTIPLPGTSKEQWLAAAAFMYPLLPSAQVSWGSLEALLVIGSKLDCPVLMEKARTFVKTGTKFSVYATSNCFVWKWIELADRLSDMDTVALIIQSVITFAGAEEFAGTCSATRLVGLSKPTSDRLLLALAPHVR